MGSHALSPKQRDGVGKGSRTPDLQSHNLAL